MVVTPQKFSHIRLIWILSLLTGLLVAFRGSEIVSALWANTGLLALLKTLPCDLDNYMCQSPYAYPPMLWEGNEVALRQAKNRLETALAYNPESPAIRLHLAEIYFAQGERWNSVDVFPVETNNMSVSPLLQEGRYEYHLTRARQLMQAERWEEAVHEFQLGLGWGGELTLPIDHRDFFLAVARMHREHTTVDRANIRSMYLAGKYLARAGHWAEALPLLNRAINSASDALMPEERGWAYTHLGRVLQQQGKTLAAREAFMEAIAYAPDLREPQIRLLKLLRDTGAIQIAQSIEAQLVKQGPGFILGQQGEGYEVGNPTTLPNGWTLVGYDVDGESLETGAPIELLLWWSTESSTRTENQTWTRIGGYWVEQRQVINLFPNAGFEWGVREDGIPLGHDRELYGATPGSLRVELFSRDGRETNVLMADNNPQAERVSLISRKIQVDPDSYYLMAGWLQDQDKHSQANIGRNCMGEQFRPGGPYYIAYRTALRPLQTWIHIGDLATPFPDEIPDICEVLVINYQNDGRAIWDNILWVRLGLPDLV